MLTISLASPKTRLSMRRMWFRRQTLERRSFDIVKRKTMLAILRPKRLWLKMMKIRVTTKVEVPTKFMRKLRRQETLATPMVARRVLAVARAKRRRS